jgi:ribosomal protein L32
MYLETEESLLGRYEQCPACYGWNRVWEDKAAAQKASKIIRRREEQAKRREAIEAYRVRWRCPSCNAVLWSTPRNFRRDHLYSCVKCKQLSLPDVGSCPSCSSKRFDGLICKSCGTMAQYRQNSDADEQKLWPSVSSRSYYLARSGGMATDFIRDWIQLKRDTGLAPREVALAMKSASPVAGAAAGYLFGNIWIGLAAAVATYLLSEDAAESHASKAIEKWCKKWEPILTKMSEEEIAVLFGVIEDKSPLVLAEYAELTTTLQLPN